MLVGAFLEEASAVGLSYLSDALPATTALELLPDAARERARSLGPEAAQQLVDFVRNTAFRRALLVRAGAAAGTGTRNPELDPGALRSLRVASRLRPRGAHAAEARQESFEAGENIVQIGDSAVRRALHELARVAPRSLAFEDLARRSLPTGSPGGDTEAALAALSAELFDLWLATGALDLYDHEPSFRTEAGERPVACPVARWHALRGDVITNRLHQEVLVPDAVVRWVLGRLDGTRTRSDLAREAARSTRAARRRTPTWRRSWLPASIAWRCARSSSAGDALLSKVSAIPEVDVVRARARSSIL